MALGRDETENRCVCFFLSVCLGQNAYANLEPAVGYCQGMNFLAGMGDDFRDFPAVVACFRDFGLELPIRAQCSFM